MALRGALALPRASLLLRTLGWKATGLGGARAASDSGPMPGPYPRTPEERAAAAKKYNLRVEDYEPYPDDGLGYGDYPKLPDRSQEERSPVYDWDNPGQRRNYGEVMHWDYDMYIRQRVDTSPTIWPWHKMRNYLLGLLGIIMVGFLVGEFYQVYPPVAPKQYPYDIQNLDKDIRVQKEPQKVKNYEI